MHRHSVPPVCNAEVWHFTAERRRGVDGNDGKAKALLCAARIGPAKALRNMAWKARAPHSPGKAKRNTVPPRKSIACPGYDPRFVETRRDGGEMHCPKASRKGKASTTDEEQRKGDAPKRFDWPGRGKALRPTAEERHRGEKHGLAAAKNSNRKFLHFKRRALL